VNIMK